MALAASCGRAVLPVYARPVVALVATGDELVELDAAPEAWQIRNSNSYGLAALVTESGGEARRLERARDVREEVRERVSKGRAADLLLISGGVSMGKYDLVEEVLEESGAEFFFTGVRMQPGRPVVFGRLPAGGGGRECLFFGLPGNPVSTEVTFHCFVRPLLGVLGGGAWMGPRWALARMAEQVEGKRELTRMLPARREGTKCAGGAVAGVRGPGCECTGELLRQAAAGGRGISPGRCGDGAAAVGWGA